MEPWLERVIAEAEELEAKCDKLAGFIDSDLFPTLEETEPEVALLLATQLAVMGAYVGILRLRITKATK